ncbi:MAG: hypothetical protein AB8B97_26060 [Granulosicoccus sp.]
MNLVTKHRALSGLLLLCAVGLGACEGESRPFQEAVEVETLGLTAIQVNPPPNSQEPLFISSGQSIQLSLTATTDTDATVTIPSGDRLWSTSDPSVFTVSDDGLLMGVGTVQGEAEVSVLVGGIQSSSLMVTVSDSTLTEIQSIEGSNTIERCLPGEYYAVGLFTDASERTLSDVTFNVANESVGSVVQPDAATAIVNATGPAAEPLMLTAQAAGAPLFTQNITILDTLQAIAIDGPDTVDQNRTIDFTANGTYNAVIAEEGEVEIPAVPAAPGSSRPEEDITENVVWEVITNTANASVETSGETIGRLTGLLPGTAVLQASCGDSPLPATVTVTVNEATVSNELSFNIERSDGILEIAVGDSFQVQTSRGTEFDEDNVVPVSDLQFSVSNLNSTDQDIDRTAVETGLVIGRLQGARVEVNVTLPNNVSGAATGSFIVQVQ